MNFSKVIVDPGNGQVLLNELASKADMMKDEMERHHRMMSMMMGPQQGERMMMGPQQGERMMMGPQQGERMMMGPMIAQAQQTDNITSSNATSVLPTTNA